VTQHLKNPRCLAQRFANFPDSSRIQFSVQGSSLLSVQQSL